MGMPVILSDTKGIIEMTRSVKLHGMRFLFSFVAKKSKRFQILAGQMSASKNTLNKFGILTCGFLLSWYMICSI